MALAHDAAKLAGFEGTAIALLKLIEQERSASKDDANGCAQKAGSLN